MFLTTMNAPLNFLLAVRKSFNADIKRFKTVKNGSKDEKFLLSQDEIIRSIGIREVTTGYGQIIRTSLEIKQ